MSSTVTTPQLGRLCDRDFFYISATHAQALARLDYFMRQQWSFAMLLGTEGSGRSSTLRAFRRRLAGQGSGVAIVDASMVSPSEFLASLMEVWKIDCHPAADVTTRWAAIEKRLYEFWYAKTCPMLMVDNIDFAPVDVQETVMRLSSLPAALASRIQFVVTAHDSHFELIDERIRQRIDLRIDLERWCGDEIREFLLAALPNTKSVDKLFTSEAIARLQQVSGGISRRVRQLVRETLLAVESQDSEQVDGATVAMGRVSLTV